MKTKDVWILRRGLKRMLVGLCPLAGFVVSGLWFYEAALAKGYLAVFCFLAGVVLLVLAVGLTYVLGMDSEPKKRGEDK